MTSEELRAALPARLLYRDALMLVLDKPAGVPVHAGPRSLVYEGPALEAAFDALRFGLPRSPSLAHRLDRDTSGCLVLGRHRRALERLTGLFEAGLVAKTYWAVVEGGPEEEAGVIDAALGRLDRSRGWQMRVDPEGQPATTHWRVLGRGHDGGTALTWLALEPLTGRTHQLRVHCAAQGWPILGDPVYGPRRTGPNLHLHARAIGVPLYPKRPAITVEAPPPPELTERLARCGWGADAQA